MLRDHEIDDITRERVVSVTALAAESTRQRLFLSTWVGRNSFHDLLTWSARTNQHAGRVPGRGVPRMTGVPAARVAEYYAIVGSNPVDHPQNHWKLSVGTSI